MHNTPLFNCPRCGEPASVSSADQICNHCRMSDLFAQLPPDVIAAADQSVVGGTPLQAIKVYKDAMGISLPDARDLYYWRNSYLRKNFPGKF
jgi:hypothetical protein